MGTLSGFLGNPVEKVVDGKKLIFNPLTVSDMDILMGMENDKEVNIDKMKKLICKSIEGTNEEEVAKLPLKMMEKLMGVILEINGMEKPKKKEDFTKGESPAQ